MDYPIPTHLHSVFTPIGENIDRGKHGWNGFVCKEDDLLFLVKTVLMKMQSGWILKRCRI